MPKWIRDPESNFSAMWDLAQVVFLLYVSITVPYRAALAVEIPFLSTTWWFDTMVDLSAYLAVAYLRTGDSDKARQCMATFLEQFREKIATGRDVEQGEARWQVYESKGRRKRKRYQRML